MQCRAYRPSSSHVQRVSSVYCASLRLAPLPGLELFKQCILVLLTQGCATDSLPALVDEAREHRTQLLRVRRLCYLHVTLQPLIGGGITAPTWQLRRDVDLVPFRMMTRRQ